MEMGQSSDMSKLLLGLQTGLAYLFRVYMHVKGVGSRANGTEISCFKLYWAGSLKRYLLVSGYVLLSMYAWNEGASNELF